METTKNQVKQFESKIKPVNGRIFCVSLTPKPVVQKKSGLVLPSSYQRRGISHQGKEEMLTIRRYIVTNFDKTISQVGGFEELAIGCEVFINIPEEAIGWRPAETRDLTTGESIVCLHYTELAGYSFPEDIELHT